MPTCGGMCPERLSSRSATTPAPWPSRPAEIVRSAPDPQGQTAPNPAGDATTAAAEPPEHQRLTGSTPAGSCASPTCMSTALGPKRHRSRGPLRWPNRLLSASPPPACRRHTICSASVHATFTGVGHALVGPNAQCRPFPHGPAQAAIASLPLPLASPLTGLPHLLGTLGGRPCVLSLTPANGVQ
jgi:hypothetical protein